jgi:hypothetical protein
MNSGNRISLNFNGDSLASVSLDEGTLNALVENKQAIIVDGGYALKRHDTLSDVGLGYYLTYGSLSAKVQLTHALGGYPSELKKESRTRLMAQFVVSF